jgi:hypothetical protein
MYLFLTGLHNLFRWLVVLGGVVAIVVMVRGLATSARWGASERRLGTLFVRSLELQFVLGLILYVISPLVRTGLRDMGAAMGNDELRFFTVEHILVMVLAVVAAEIGFAMARRAGSDRAKFVRATSGFVLAGLLIGYGIPWWRPLIPWL